MTNLNLPNECKDLYKEFTGSYSSQMPLIKDEKRVLIGVAEIAQRILVTRNGPKEVRDFWLFKNFSTSDGITYNPFLKESFVILDSEELQGINSESPITHDGALSLAQEREEALEKYNLLKKQKNAIPLFQGFYSEKGGWVTEQEALNSKLRRILNHHPDEVPKELAISGLHEEIIPYIFSLLKQNFCHKTGMETYLAHQVSSFRKGNLPEIRPIHIDKIGGIDSSGRYNICDLINLTYSFNNLVGKLIS